MFGTNKEDLRSKARLVVEGHALDSSHLKPFSSVVQLVSVRMLLAIAASNKMNVVSVDARNAFPYANTMKKVHAIAGIGFGFREGFKVKIIKNMHDQATSRSW